LQQPLLQVSQTRLVKTITASLRYFPRNFFARNGFGCICQDGLEVQVSQELYALLRVMLLLLLL
jgi:hypothetical protein